MPTFDITTDEGWGHARVWLRRQRQKAHITQGAVAAIMGTSQPEISRFERGLTDPHLRTIRRYVRAIGLIDHIWAEPDETGEEAEQ